MIQKDEEYYKGLLQKYLTDTSTPSQTGEVLDYLKKKESSRILLEHMREGFDAGPGEYRILPAEVSQRLWERLSARVVPARSKPMWPVRRAWNGIAAASVILFCIGMLYFFTTAPSSGWREISTLPGEQKKIELPDGSLIRLNGNSALRYSDAFSRESRVVHLTGEAFFEIVSDMAAGGFYVIAPQFSTRVTGTSFNVDTDLEPGVSVRSGKVEVAAIPEHSVKKELAARPGFTEWLMHRKGSSRKMQVIWEQAAPGKRVLIMPGEKATFLANSWHKTADPAGNSWLEGELTFFDQPLQLVVKQLNRYYGERLEISAGLKDCRITITIKDKSFYEVLKALSAVTGAELVQSGRTWILQGRCE